MHAKMKTGGRGRQENVEEKKEQEAERRWLKNVSPLFKNMWNSFTKNHQMFCWWGDQRFSAWVCFSPFSPFLLMFFWLSKQRGNLTHSCRHAFMTTFSWPVTLRGSFWHFSRVERQAIGSGYEAAAATTQVERWQFSEGSRAELTH